MMKKVIIVGSGPNMIKINEWDTSDATVVGVNNVWQGTDKWNVLLHAGDYPKPYRIPVKEGQYKVTRWGPKSFIDSFLAMAKVYAERDVEWQEARLMMGLPIVFAATYWAMHYLRPDVIGYIGTDMDYTPDKDGSTHFYGVGNDISRRGIPDYMFQQKMHYDGDENFLDVLFERASAVAEKRRVRLVNLSDNPNSKLPWERMIYEEFKKL